MTPSHGYGRARQHLLATPICVNKNALPCMPALPGRCAHADSNEGCAPSAGACQGLAGAPDPTEVFMPSTHARQTAALLGTYEARTAPKREPRRTPGDSSIIEIPICNFAMSLTSQGVWW